MSQHLNGSRDWVIEARRGSFRIFVKVKIAVTSDVQGNVFRYRFETSIVLWLPGDQPAHWSLRLRIIWRSQVHPPVHYRQSNSCSNAGLGEFGGVAQRLARADVGAAAWKILCAASMFEAVLFGEHHIRLPPTNFINKRGH